MLSSIKFWDHLITSEGSVVHQIYNATKMSNPWVKKLNIIIQNLGLSYLSNVKPTIKRLFGFIKQRIIDQGIQEQHANISASPKLTFFQNVYIMNERAAYVDALRNRSDRSSLCKLRVSAHNLAIERGRYLV